MARAIPLCVSANCESKFRGTVIADVPGVSNGSVKPGNVEPPNVKPRSRPFPRSARLLRHADFERVYKLGRRHFSSSMTVFYLQRQPDAAPPSIAIDGLRVGFTVGRALGGAVDRNRMKRRLREAVRLCRPPAGSDADVVINPKKALLKIDFAQVVIEVRRAFEAIETKLQAKPKDARSSS